MQSNLLFCLIWFGGGSFALIRYSLMFLIGHHGSFWENFPHVREFIAHQCFSWIVSIEGSRGSQETTETGLFEWGGLTIFLRAIFLGISLAFLIAPSTIPGWWFLFIRYSLSSWNLVSRSSDRLHTLLILNAKLRGIFWCWWGGWQEEGNKYILLKNPWQ